MTASSHRMLDLAAAAPHRRTVEVRWISMTTGREDVRGEGGDGSCRPLHQEIVLSLHVVDHRRALLEMWIQTPRLRKQILPPQPVSCSIVDDGEMLHVDASLDGRRVIAVSIGQDDRLVYARSDLLDDAGFPGGTFDPPMLTCHRVDRNVASA